MIIVFFAITFVVVYLYYTIKDVKKITSEVQKLSKDVLTLSQSISSITSTLLTQTPVCYAPTQQNPTASNIQVTQKPRQLNEVQDDASSEAVDDLHKIIETIDDESPHEENMDVLQIDKEPCIESIEGIEVIEGIEDIESIETTEKEQSSTPLTTRLDAKTLKGLSYEALKKYCKENGIDAKGNKETLIGKILAS
jgi:hypothetical protein